MGTHSRIRAEAGRHGTNANRRLLARLVLAVVTERTVAAERAARHGAATVGTRIARRTQVREISCVPIRPVTVPLLYCAERGGITEIPAVVHRLPQPLVNHVKRNW